MSDEYMKKQILCLLLIIMMTACTGHIETQTTSTKRITIATTFYPLFDLTRSIAGDKADVYSIVPTDAEPHEYEETPQDIIKLNKADAFVTMGIQFAGFENKLIEATNIKIIPAGKNIPLIDVKNELGDPSDESGNDPHIWVSPKNAVKMAENIRDGLIELDPENKDYYANNADSLIASLISLDADYASGLKDCKQDTILAAHDAYSYLARDYGFRSYFISGLTPESEPSPQQIKRLIDLAEQKHLKYIFYEEVVDPRISQTIAEQVGAITMPLSPVENVPEVSKTYVEVMQENLNRLKIALECN